jgi:hypothetical protein
MTTYPILFNQTPEQLRRIGARGGRACARNRRARQRASRAVPVVLAAPPAALPTWETTGQAIAKLDAQFPWLCRAEQRACRR